MDILFGVPPQVLFGQLLIGLINGAFYAVLSLGLAVIFGLMNVINFVHGAQYMMGAFAAWFMLRYAGLGYWYALCLAPLAVGAAGAVIERVLLRFTYKLDHLYGLLLTFGLSLIIEGLFRQQYGTSGQSYAIPPELRGGFNLGFMFLPIYRAWAIFASLAVCLLVWFLIEKTRLGSYLRAATENRMLVRNFGINVPLMVTMTYAGGAALAAFAGVLAAPIYQVNPLMGSNVIVVVFAVVVIGGMGSILGAVASGLILGVFEGLVKVVWPEASSTAIFVVMVLVLLIKPAGLFGKVQEFVATGTSHARASVKANSIGPRLGLALLILGCAAPFILYPVFLMKALCFALFACAFNLLLGYVGLLSFGHAAFFGSAAYIAGYAAKAWGCPPEIAILTAAGASTLLGGAFGWLAIRRQGIYFAMITLALAQMIYFVAIQARFTGGEDGLQAIPRGMFLGMIDLNRPLNMYYFVFGVFLLGFILIYRVVHSPFGHVVKSIRDHEPRAISLGYDTDRYKLLAFSLSAGLAGVAGATKALVFQLASLTDVHWATSGSIVLMTLVGGLGTMLGPIVGAFIVVTMEQYLAPFGSWSTIIQGFVFVLCVLFFRRGIVGEIYRFVRVAPASLASGARLPRPPAPAPSIAG